MIKLRIGTAVAAATLAVPAIAYAGSAQATTPSCVTVQDHIAKTDNGHGTPSEWADLSLKRTTKVCGNEKVGYTIKLTDKGRLRTIKGAGTPNGTGGQILNRVPGFVAGIYSLKATGGTLAVPVHRDTSLSSTEYVKSLFSQGTTVTGGPYAWAYATLCGEKWLDSSVNNDGQGAAAGNITGKRCGKPSPTPTPTDTGTGTPTPSPTTSTPGEAPVPTPVNTDLPVTG
jgi:hypothetical protein